MEITKEELKETIEEAISEALKSEKKDKLTMTLDETCKLSGIGKNKLWELVYKENTDFPYFKVGTKVLVNRDKLINWLNNLTDQKRTV
ncbi:MAG: helix-turn-helix domain-containing protein [Clostridium sp.]|nr:helix-turn-helix domain-containing protein [Clostridium sp.]